MEKTPEARQELLEVLRNARALLALPDNDFAWSSWNGPTWVQQLNPDVQYIGDGPMPVWYVKPDW
jgi:hypothetical protein